MSIKNTALRIAENNYYTENQQGELLLINEELLPYDQLMVIRGLAKYIYLNIDGKKNLQQIIQQIKEQQRITSDKFEQDATHFIEKLLKIGIVLQD